MGDDDWDVGVAVRSCNINRPDNVVAPKLELETSLNDVWNSFDKLFAPDMTNFNDLSKIFSLDFPTAHQEKPDDQVIIINQNGNQQLYLHPIQPAQFIQQSSFPPSPTTVVCVPPTTTTPKEWIDLQQQLDIGVNNYLNFTFSMETPLIQTRTRNYYKCSTSKLCEARKKFEKSPNDENIFLVSYSASKRHKYLPKTSTLNASSSSSKRIKHSRDVASPIIATMPLLEFGSKNKMIVAAIEDKGDGKEEVDMNEDILMGFE
ncbi:hypothetical protein H5410_022422 [Solanum commersonii]|uniref:WRKY domain-containing protein n=1 Tax=Solanum commersonii TaxID=4109 RepID=A0A9J5ZFE0_SOLCO|nr:hypothetical protein H5410_022422 [Solanum commersonii]